MELTKITITINTTIITIIIIIVPIRASPLEATD